MFGVEVWVSVGAGWCWVVLLMLFGRSGMDGGVEADAAASSRPSIRASSTTARKRTRVWIYLMKQDLDPFLNLQLPMCQQAQAVSRIKP